MLIIPTVIEGISSRKDRTIKITLGTQELSPQDAGELYKFSQDVVYCAFKKDNFGSAERKILDDLKVDGDLELNTKSKAKRLQNVLFILWQQKPEGHTVFSEFYEYMMEKIITHFKNKLE